MDTPDKRHLEELFAALVEYREYLTMPNSNQAYAYARASILGQIATNAASKVECVMALFEYSEDWPGWPYNSYDYDSMTDLNDGSIFSIAPEQRKKLMDRLWLWIETVRKELNNGQTGQ